AKRPSRRRGRFTVGSNGMLYSLAHISPELGNGGQPRHRESGGSLRGGNTSKLLAWVEGRRRPHPHVLWIPPEFLEAGRPFGSGEDVDAAIRVGRLVTGEYGP